MKKNITSLLILTSTINESLNETIHTKMCSQRRFLFHHYKTNFGKNGTGFFKLDNRTQGLILSQNCYQVGKKVSQLYLTTVRNQRTLSNFLVCSGSFWLVAVVMVRPVISLKGSGVEMNRKVM